MPWKSSERHFEDVAKLMRNMNRDHKEKEVLLMMKTLDLSKDGNITFDEFVKVFIGNIRTAQSM